MVELVRSLVTFGMYSSAEMIDLLPVLMQCLDTAEATVTASMTPILVRARCGPAVAWGPLPGLVFDTGVCDPGW